jgi:hypothetical protein
VGKVRVVVRGREVVHTSGVDEVPASDGGEEFSGTDGGQFVDVVVEVQPLQCQVIVFTFQPLRIGGPRILVIQLGKEFPATFSLPPDEQAQIVEPDPRSRLIAQI